MAVKTMSIHQALAEVKMYNSKIYKASNEVFVSCARKGTDKLGSYTKEEYSNLIKGNFDKATALIENVKRIKAAIVLSNANTKVTIGGVEYTVAEAIERKNMINYEINLLTNLQKQYFSTTQKIENENNMLSDKLETYLKSVVNEKDKNNPEIVKGYEKQFRDANEYEIIDPNKIADYINKLDTEITDFNTEVDYKLSESNTITQITVDLVD